MNSSKLYSFVKLFIIIKLSSTYKNLLDLAWLDRFLYFGVLKWQISAGRVLNSQLSKGFRYDLEAVVMLIWDYPKTVYLFGCP